MVNPIRHVMDGLTSFVSRMGTERDKSATTFYAPTLLTDQQALAAYDTSALAKNIVDLPAIDSCREWRDWQAEASQIGLIEAEEKRLNVRQKVLSARKWARLFGGSAIFIGTGDADLAAPLEIDRIGKGGLQYLTVVDKSALSPTDIDNEPASEWYGKPKSYNLSGNNGKSAEIHPSRLVIFTGNERPNSYIANNDGWGASVLVSTIDSIKQADGTAANIAALVFEAKIDVIGVPDLFNRLADPRFEQQMLNRFSVAAVGKGIHGTLIMDTDETYEQKTASFATLPDILMSFMQVVSGASRIPATMLLGQAPQGMNSTGESDARNYAARIASEQALYMTPAMHRMDECLIRSALGSRPAEVFYTWAPVIEMSEAEKANIFKLKADAARALAGTGTSPSLMPIEALSDALVNTFIEDGSLPGLEAAIEEYGKLSEQEDDPEDVEAAVVVAKPEKVVKPEE